MRFGVVLVAALALAGPATGIAAEKRTPAIARAAEWPNLVFLDRVEGLLPADSSDFVAGVDQAFDPDFYLTEDRTGGAPRVSMALANRFRRVRGDPFGDEWHVSMRIDTPEGGPTDSLSRLAITVAVLRPEAVGSGAPADHVAEEFSFDLPSQLRAAWFWHAGRAAGLLAVEALHHRSRDLDPDTRVRIDGAVRTPVELRRSPPHR